MKINYEGIKEDIFNNKFKLHGVAFAFNMQSNIVGNAL